MVANLVVLTVAFTAHEGDAAASDRLPPPSNVPASAGGDAPCEVTHSLGRLPTANPTIASAPVGSKSLCSAWNFVLQRLASAAATGGRKLEGERPLDLAVAARENEMALADPEFVADLDRLMQGETDDLRKKLLKAALLQDYGHFSACQALLLEIKPVLNP